MELMVGYLGFYNQFKDDWVFDLDVLQYSARFLCIGMIVSKITIAQVKSF